MKRTISLNPRTRRRPYDLLFCQQSGNGFDEAFLPELFEGYEPCGTGKADDFRAAHFKLLGDFVDLFNLFFCKSNLERDRRGVLFVDRAHKKNVHCNVLQHKAKRQCIV